MFYKFNLKQLYANRNIDVSPNTEETVIPAEAGIHCVILAKIFILFIIIGFFLSGCKEEKVLPSWNNTENRQKIIEYVKDVVNKNSPNFIPIEDRIAVFDNDGTLWTEKPLIQGLFIFNRVMSGNYSSLEITKAKLLLASGKNLETMDIKDLVKILLDVQAGVSPQELEADVVKYFNSQKYSKYGIKMSQVAYRPQVEFVKYLQDNGFKVYICSGGDTDFMRGISKELYNIDKEYVIGSTIKYKYNFNDNKIIRTNQMLIANDMELKPVNIAQYIGKIPVIAVGNIGNSGDVDMLKYSQSSNYKTLQFLVNHDDEIRETAYGKDDARSFREAEKNGWDLISIKNDWRVVFE